MSHNTTLTSNYSQRTQASERILLDTEGRQLIAQLLDHQIPIPEDELKLVLV